jgi:hypothetical protein
MGGSFLLVSFLVPIMENLLPLIPVLVPFMGGPKPFIPVKAFRHPPQPMIIGDPSTSLAVSTLLFLVSSFGGAVHIILLM